MSNITGIPPSMPSPVDNDYQNHEQHGTDPNEVNFPQTGIVNFKSDEIPHLPDFLKYVIFLVVIIGLFLILYLSINVTKGINDNMLKIFIQSTFIIISGFLFLYLMAKILDYNRQRREKIIINLGLLNEKSPEIKNSIGIDKKYLEIDVAMANQYYQELKQQNKCLIKKHEKRTKKLVRKQIRKMMRYGEWK